MALKCSYRYSYVTQLYLNFFCSKNRIMHFNITQHKHAYFLGAVFTLFTLRS